MLNTVFNLTCALDGCIPGMITIRPYRCFLGAIEEIRVLVSALHIPENNRSWAWPELCAPERLVNTGVSELLADDIAIQRIPAGIANAAPVWVAVNLYATLNRTIAAS